MIGLNDIGSIPMSGILILSYDRIVKMHFGGGLFSFLGGEITLAPHQAETECQSSAFSSLHRCTNSSLHPKQLMAQPSCSARRSTEPDTSLAP